MQDPQQVVAKFSPERLTTSGKMTAILGFLLGKQWTDPHIVEMVVTSDGHVLAARAGDCGANDFIGSVGDLKSNLRGVVDAVGLSPDERNIFVSVASGRIRDYSGRFDLAETIST